MKIFINWTNWKILLFPRKFNKKIYNDSNPKESYRSNLSRWEITKFKSTSKHPYLRIFQQDNWKKWKEKKKKSTYEIISIVATWKRRASLASIHRWWLKCGVKGACFAPLPRSRHYRKIEGMSKKGTEKKMVAGGRAKTRLYGRRRRRRNSSSRNHGGIVGPSFPPRFSYLFLFSVMRTYVGLPLRERRNDEKGMETDVTEGRETREPHKFCPLPRMGKSRSSGDIFVLPSRISVHRLYFHFEPLQIDAKKKRNARIRSFLDIKRPGRC